MIDVLEALRGGLAPHYTVEREIGAGGMARVFLGVERHPLRKVAIKVMNPEMSTPGLRERFLREIQVTSKLNHPHIVPIFAAEECRFAPDGPDGLCYYIMPYVEGESLRARLLRDTTLPLPDAMRITFQVGDALRHAHDCGIIHRDVKPENILMSANNALVADFGIARAISAAHGITLTAVGQPIGSPAYMSPEQLAGSRAVDARTDVYSLACVLFEMLVGQPPLLDLAEGSAPAQPALERALRARGVSHRTARHLRATMARALASLPADRFASMEEFVTGLRDAVEGPGSRVWRPQISRRALLIGGAVLVGAASGLALWLLN